MSRFIFPIQTNGQNDYFFSGKVKRKINRSFFYLEKKKTDFSQNSPFSLGFGEWESE